MNRNQFDYRLPKELIAQHPLPRRADSRLMVLDRRRGSITHTRFHRIPEYVHAGDLLVANNTRVIPARLYGKKETGGWVEVFLLSHVDNNSNGTQLWECLLSSRRRIHALSKICFSSTFFAEALQQTSEGIWTVCLHCSGSLDEAIRNTGTTPLPPYIRRDRRAPADRPDRMRYQTVYAKKDGAVAAPTAGLHFTRRIMQAIRNKGARFAFLTLHVGYGTFQPIHEARIENHKMHQELYSVSRKTAEAINTARVQGGRIIAVGTTTTRALETLTGDNGVMRCGQGSTDLFIHPGYAFRAVDALITNFHLPMSSLLILVAAFAGREFVLRAYNEAVEKGYRFFSYGDAMLIL